MVYIDTSALAKWYLNEPGSEDFARWIVDEPEPWISSLTVTELRCLLARRRRAGEIAREHETQCLAAFQQDEAEGHLHVHPVDDAAVQAAASLIGRLMNHPLRTLDALHLALARQVRTPTLATADATMAAAAEELGMAVVRFGS